MIADPINDAECLGQLTTFARELAPSTLVRLVAARLGTREAVILWLQSLPQADDHGEEQIRFIMCDVPQRTRLFPDDPNCVERSFAALMLLEATDPKTRRALATVDKPLRHTGLVEQFAGHWHAVDLFPRRNANRNFQWGDLLTGAHQYVGKPILKFYLGDTGGRVADALGEQEAKLVGQDKRKQPEKKPAPPPAAGAQRPVEQPKPQPAPSAQPSGFSFTQLFGAGAKQTQSNPVGGGENDAQKEKAPRGAGRAAVDGDGEGAAQQTADRDRRRAHDAREEAAGFWWRLGRKGR
ncbi:MAG TPA: hypothetical protein VGL86_19285 [Polyangia bacterium]